MYVAPTKWLLVQDRRMIINKSGSANLTSTYNDSILEVFKDIAIYPDSDVILARRYDNDFLELISIYRPSPQREVIWEDRGNWTLANGLRMRTFQVASARRRNLQRTALKSCVLVNIYKFKRAYLYISINYPYINKANIRYIDNSYFSIYIL